MLVAVMLLTSVACADPDTQGLEDRLDETTEKVDAKLDELDALIEAVKALPEHQDTGVLVHNPTGPFVEPGTEPITLPAPPESPPEPSPEPPPAVAPFDDDDDDGETMVDTRDSEF